MDPSNGAGHGDAPQEGRALLQCAVLAIQDNRWEDLTTLLQGHAPTLQAARRRLEQQALERHAARARSEAAMPAPPSPQKPAAKVGVVAPRAEPVEKKRARPQGSSGLAIALCRWADDAPWMALMAVQVAVLASYLPALAYEGYKMDDTVAVEKNPIVIAEELSLHELMRRDFWGLPMHGSGWTNKSFRPLTTLTFRWNYLLHGLESSGFHITNVLLHILASVLVGRTGTTSLGLSGFWAAAAAAFFGVHPVHTENVLYLVGRADILAAILGLAAIMMYSSFFCPPPALQRVFGVPAVAEPRRQALGAYMLLPPLALVVASGLCKEIGFTLFALFLLMELLDFVGALGEAGRTGQKMQPKVWRQTRLRVGLLVASTLLVFVARYRHTGGTKLNMSPQDNPISFESEQLTRMLSYAFLHGVYMKLLVFPSFLCYDYSMDAIPMLRSFQDCRLLLPLAAYVGAFALLSVALRAPERYRPAGLLSLALLVVSFIPASNIFFPVGTVIGERLMYMPSAGFCLFVVVCLHRACAPPGAPRPAPTQAEGQSAPKGAAGAKKAGRGNARAPPRRDNGHAVANGADANGSAPAAALSPGKVRSLLLACSVGGAVVTGLGVRTLARTRIWETSESLYLNDGLLQPTSSKVQFNLGITYMQQQEWDLAVEALIRCAWADPLSSLPFYRIGQIEIMRGRFEVAEQYLASALDKFGASMMVKDEEVFHDLSIAMFQNGKKEQAEKRLRIALQLNPDFAKGWNNLACCIASRSLQDAVRAAHKAVSLAPDSPAYWSNLAILSQHSGDQATANQAWQRATMLWPEAPTPQDCSWEFNPGG